VDTEAFRHLTDHQIAFEVDEVDEFLRAGCSVLVVGNAQPLDEASLLLLDLGQSSQPWPAGPMIAGHATASHDDGGPFEPLS
jgi:hypothetical protein